MNSLFSPTHTTSPGASIDGGKVYMNADSDYSPLATQERQLSGRETLKLFSQILDATANGGTEYDSTDSSTRQHDVSFGADIMY